MNSRITTTSLVLAICLITSGCMYVPRGDEVEISLYGDSNQTQSDVALNPISASNSEFVLDGYLATGGGAPDRTVYRDIFILLYAEDKQLICSHRVGDWNVSTGGKDVAFSTTSRPHFVVIHSDDFWNEPMAVEYFVFDTGRGQYLPEDADSEDELPTSVSEVAATPC